MMSDAVAHHRMAQAASRNDGEDALVAVERFQEGLLIWHADDEILRKVAAAKQELTRALSLLDGGSKAEVRPVMEPPSMDPFGVTEADILG